MSRYQRSTTPGTSYFFTLVSYRRRPILCDEPVRAALRNAIETTRRELPFSIDAWVLMPDHLHCIWTLPEGDAGFSARWSKIKRRVSLSCHSEYRKDELLTPSRRRRRESTVWQRRYWEHMIRDDTDMAAHFHYIHYNPVRHGLAAQAQDWPWSSFHRCVRQGIYSLDWATPPAPLMSSR
jgi:putative transposase